MILCMAKECIPYIDGNKFLCYYWKNMQRIKWKGDYMGNTTKLYGIVEGYENISFVLDGFQCVFFNADPKPKTSTTIPQDQGFILGRTSKHKYVYIYSGQDLEIWNG